MILSCNSNEESAQRRTEDPLPSFNDGKAKQSIIDFVEAVSAEESEHFVAPEERIVCFDNDGTLWTEQPLPNQIYFTIDRIKTLAKEHPELTEEQPFKAVIENDTVTMRGFNTEDIIKLVAKADAIENVEDFGPIVNQWFQTARHPRYDRSFEKIIYQPMIELLDYLRAHDFKIYIVSGGSVEFMRPVTQRLYGIPPSRVIGSRMERKTVREGDRLHVQQTEKFEFNDDREGKVTSIANYIGMKPIMVVGNSDGDLAMMEYASQQDIRTLMVYLDHTDGIREYDYSKGVLTGALKEGREVAQQKGWTIIDMSRDWNTVFVD